MTLGFFVAVAVGFTVGIGLAGVATRGVLSVPRPGNRLPVRVYIKNVFQAPVPVVLRIGTIAPLLILPWTNPFNWVLWLFTIPLYVWMSQQALTSAMMQGFFAGRAAGRVGLQLVDLDEFMDLCEEHGVPPQEIEKLVWKNREH